MKVFLTLIHCVAIASASVSTHALSQSCDEVKHGYQKFSCCPSSFDSADYVIVGSGAGGSSVAIALAEKHPDKTVLVVESGKPRTPDSWETTPDRRTGKDYLPESHRLTKPKDDPFTGDVSPHVLGGGTAINAMHWHLLANDYPFLPQVDMDALAVMGAELEAAMDVQRSLDYQRHPDLAPYALARTLSNVDGTFENSTNSVWGNGLSIGKIASQTVYPDTNRKGDVTIRRSGGAYLLETYPGNNLRILTETEVVEVLTDSGRATGVRTSDGRTISAAESVVVSCGALYTPWLLMKSGFGPAEELAKHNISVKEDLPTGENSYVPYQHLAPKFVFKGQYSIEEYYPGTLIGYQNQWVSSDTSIGEPGANWFAVFWAFSGLFEALQGLPLGSLTAEMYPYIDIPAIVGAPIYRSDVAQFKDILKTLEFQFEGRRNFVGRGRVSLDPDSEGPQVTYNWYPSGRPEPDHCRGTYDTFEKQFNVLEENKDLFITTMEELNALKASTTLHPSMMSLLNSVDVYGGFVTNSNITENERHPDWSKSEFCINDATSPRGHVWHPMSSAYFAIDHDFKVIGTENLYVADASVFPEYVDTNPMGPIMQMGRYIGKNVISSGETADIPGWSGKEYTATVGEVTLKLTFDRVGKQFKIMQDNQLFYDMIPVYPTSTWKDATEIYSAKRINTYANARDGTTTNGIELLSGRFKSDFKTLNVNITYRKLHSTEEEWIKNEWHDLVTENVTFTS
jgi:hypothetical protein